MQGPRQRRPAITDAFRLEMAPLGVKVVTVHTGAVRTNTLASGKAFRLPATSHYKGIEKEIAARARGRGWYSSDETLGIRRQSRGGRIGRVLRGRSGEAVMLPSCASLRLAFRASVSVSQKFSSRGVCAMYYVFFLV